MDFLSSKGWFLAKITSTVRSIKTEFIYCLSKLSFYYKKLNFKAPGDLYCWDIGLNLFGIVGTSPGPADRHKGGCIYYVVVSYKNDVRRAKKKVRPPP